MTALSRTAALIPEAHLERLYGVSKYALRQTGVEPAEVTPTGRALHSIESAERVAERLAQTRKTP